MMRLKVSAVMAFLAALPCLGPTSARAGFLFVTQSFGSNSGQIDQLGTDGTGFSTIASIANPAQIALNQATNTIYYAQLGKGQVGDVSFTGSNNQLIATGQNRPAAVAVAGSQVYWTDFGSTTGSNGDIRSANLDGTSQATVMTGLQTPSGLAVDAVAGKLYWTNFNGGTVLSSNLDGTNQQTLVSGLGRPTGIALDSATGQMFWTNQSNGTIDSANLDGSNFSVIVSGLNNPSGITIDVAGGKLYWTDSNTGDIETANLNGSGQAVVYTGLTSPNGIAYIVAVPEPSSMALLGVGLASYFAWRRRGRLNSARG